MTVTLDKKQIHLGWETAASILVVGIPFLLGCGYSANKFFTKQETMYNAVISIKADNENNKKLIAKNRTDIDSLIRVVKPITASNSYGLKYYIQIKRNGKIYWELAPNIN